MELPIEAEYKSPSVIQNILLACLLALFTGISPAQDIADIRAPVLTLLEEHRDFMSHAPDLLRANAITDITTTYTRLFSIAAVAARGNDIFVVDTSQRAVFRIDRMQRSISKFASVQGGTASDLYVADDLSVYVVDQLQRQVIQYSRDGQVIANYANSLDLSSPVAVVESDESHRVLIADRLSSHIAVFSRTGRLSGRIGENINIPSTVSSINAMVSDRDWIYLLDQTAREVSVIDNEGIQLYKVGREDLKQPVSIAVDECQRLYVADQFDNSIHIYHFDEPVLRIENSRRADAVQLLTDIWIDYELLYVADGISGSIKVFRIEGGCL